MSFAYRLQRARRRAATIDMDARRSGARSTIEFDRRRCAGAARRRQVSRDFGSRAHYSTAQATSMKDISDRYAVQYAAVESLIDGDVDRGGCGARAGRAPRGHGYRVRTARAAPRLASSMRQRISPKAYCSDAPACGARRNDRRPPCRSSARHATASARRRRSDDVETPSPSHSRSSSCGADLPTSLAGGAPP